MLTFIYFNQYINLGKIQSKKICVLCW